MGLKVFDLRCALDHRFEGWFGSEQDYLDQRERRLLTCPLCDNAVIERVPSAARLNVAKAAEPAASPAPHQTASGQTGHPTTVQTTGVDLQAMWMQAVRHVMANTEDVGERFAAEAREIHHGRADARGIRGQATAQEAAELREEGIEVHSMSVPAALRGPVQ
jgi:hypothetical protein